MSESYALIKELKRQLKLSGLHYVDVAQHLEVSEGTVKRLLAEGHQISLERLERICQLIGLEMAELFKLAASHNKGLESLTLEQEKHLIEDKALLLVAVCVLNGYQFEQIIEQYIFCESELVQKLAQLDHLNIIDLLPGNKLRLRVSPTFQWQTGGPIQRFFQQQVQEAFFQSYFSAEDEKLSMATGLMSIPTNKKLQHKLQKVIDEFYQACQSDNSLEMREKHGTSLVIAMRRWTFPLFELWERAPIKK
ncbi:helix-turn-helix transcriptional regulator [Vibrio sp. B1FLJ16]|uniref:helix-turn-helix domain-containing protein n=1 Tax=Vibrio sp. B1FLJ16 TaxID=2751178 RepID=UPI0015F4B298|nr:helix-turn-helix transcriptional regulator [Vibrio sp. B1FLJ16]CAD7821399.1 Cro/C1-type HTH DNA-binding domain [Vibrio sp. B1FLJ16]CAE6946148.1 Cro/C1-type HTH DNA-binding domain [Vibrio sp. B1FLJ16]